MVANHFMIAVLWLQTLSCGYAIKRSFTLKPTTTTTKPVLPVNGGWASWTTWSTCTRTCGTGSTGRTRSCTNPAPQNSGAQCSGSATDTKVCNSNQCSVDGGWASWTTWSTCTRSCGTGSTGRTRSCTNPAPQNNGAQCSGSISDTKVCNSNHCPVDGGWASWTTWSTCTRSCGTGSTGRTRSCSNPAPQNNGAQCSGSTTDTKVCNYNQCPVDGGWTYWAIWSTCTRSCGTGSSSRTRSCTNPAPHNNGAQCSGSPTEHKGCNYNRCPVDGGWTYWTMWSTCIRSCGTGSSSRTRSCTNPTPANNGATCSGSANDFKSCNVNHCPVNGGWGQWSRYRTCTNTCGTGTKTRYRYCNSPRPAHGGTNCYGNDYDTQTCYLGSCPGTVNGGWGQWTGYQTCSKTCGTGTKTRYRYCNSPRPAHGGTNCYGNDYDTQTCYLGSCPGTVNGGWGQWTGYQTCSKTCGTGTKTRYRYCNSPRPAHGGTNCYGNDYDTQTCYLGSCPGTVNGGWGQWTGYQTCSKTCGTGTKTRYRYCNSPRPAHGGTNCYGNGYDTQTCQLGACPGTGSITSGTSGVCIDKNTKCHEYSYDVCTDPKYDTWANENCCAYCSGGTGGGTGNGGTFISGGTMTGGTIPGTCTDVITDCADYGAHVCTNPEYENWVSENCPRFCNRCTGNGGTGGTFKSSGTMVGGTMAGTCTDTIDNCAAYATSVCTDPEYYAWVSEKCPRFCNKCSGSSGTMTGTGTGTMSGNGCVYSGHLYTQGQTWKDGCKFSCQCVDGSTGKYTCTQLCVQWQLPSECYMTPPAPGKCCQTPVCPAGFVIQYPQGYTEQ